MLPRPPLTALMFIIAQVNADAAECLIDQHVKHVGVSDVGVSEFACVNCPPGTMSRGMPRPIPTTGGEPTYCQVKMCPANSVATDDGTCDVCGTGLTSVAELKNGFPAYCTGDDEFINELDSTIMVDARAPNTEWDGCVFGSGIALEDEAEACEPDTCDANEYVQGGICVACPAGYFSLAGALTNAGDGDVSTTAVVDPVQNECAPKLCNSNEYVKTESTSEGTTHDCAPCPAGQQTPGFGDCTQDTTTGVCTDFPDCGEDGIHDHASTPGRRPHTASDAQCGNTDPSALPKGRCVPIVCTTSPPQYVKGNVCTNCPTGSEDLASGHGHLADSVSDTECTSKVCGENTYATGTGACSPCTPGTFYPAGDKMNVVHAPSGPPCQSVQCPINHWVQSTTTPATSPMPDEHGTPVMILKTCAACPAGTTTKVGVWTDSTSLGAIMDLSMLATIGTSCLAPGADAVVCPQICVAEECGANFKAENGECVPCPAGTSHAGGDNTGAPGTPCTSTACQVNEHVLANECVPCPAGMTNTAGDLADGPDTECDTTVCPEHFFVEDHACQPCRPGTTNVAAALRDASRSDSQCEVTLCGASERVLGHSCVPCSAGSTRAAGDDASGSDTQCVHICLTSDNCDPGEHCNQANACASNICTENEYVASNFCQACPPGTWRAAGDDASGPDTVEPPCAPTLCGPNMYVKSNACVACPPGTTNQVGGGDASGPDTFESCVHTICSVDQHVVSNVCVACALGSNHPAGDDATNPDTSCEHNLCADGQHVMSNACVACAAGMLRTQGQQPDDATGDDTSCEPKLCEADQHVSSNECVPCGAGTTTDAGHDASGPDTSCTAICTSDAHCDAEQNCNTAKNRCESITPAPPTSTPTTSAPTTSAPTTSAPTTSAPTTSAPTPGPKTCGGEPDPVRCRDLACPTFKESCRAKCDNCPATVPPTKAKPATVWTLEADKAKCKGGGKPIFVVDRAACEKHAEDIGATHYSFRSDRLQCATVPGHGKATDCQHKETPGRQWQIYSSGQSTTPPPQVPPAPSCFSNGKIKKSKQCNGGMGKPLRNLASPEACQAKCKESEKCMSFTFTLSGKCALKSCEFGNGNLVPVKNGKRISGPKQC